MPDDISLPLPTQSQAIGPVERAEDGYRFHPDVDNLHLAFYRLAPTEVGDEDGTKRQYLEALITQWDRLREDAWAQSDAPLTAIRQRQNAQMEHLSDAGRSTRRLQLETEGRLVAGLGYDSPTEVGLTLHPLYGVPYLPGSSVKGVARAYAERVEEADAEDLLHVFGSTSLDDPGAEKRRGRVTFLDAVPARVPRLELDVMTPHHGEYYTSDDPPPPGDWHEPTPVHFLAVAAGTPFQFCLVADTNEHLEQACAWLRQGLFWLGAGGKTSSGYGLFTDETRRRAAEEERTQRRIEAELPPKMEDVGKNTSGILARVLGPTKYDTIQEAKIDVVLHVEGYEEDRIPMTGAAINVERFEADWVTVRVDRFLGEDFPLVRYEGKWRP